ncbi:RluA family pseudouridine synthase [Brevibacillus laterosporus]|uniref:RluA family pseudouridine synthase n=1 Tax=Brevibacillus laterosporus TaxID=1465 RepID=UPI003D25C68D
MKELLLRFHASEQQAGRSLREVLQKDYEISRKLLIRAKFSGEIQINGELAFVTRIVEAGDIITIWMDEEESENLEPEAMDLQIRYEDEDVLVLAKPPGIVVHPTGMHVTGTLANGVIHYWQQKGERRKFRPVSRLDKDTTGLIIIAKNQWAHDRFSRMQKNRSLKRRYQALVHGRVTPQSGVIDAPIGRKEESIIEREVCPDGQQAVTHYQVLKSTDDLSHIQLQLETGRTHQIRVHMSYLGYPLLGDDLYGGRRELIGRQALHAFELRFQHPRTGEEICLTEPLPEDMQKIVECSE